MRVTPLNIVRYWRRLMFPADRHGYYMNRLTLKADLPWEPWLHCAVWLATIAAVLVGRFESAIPPISGVDWVWVLFGLLSPPLGFFSVWALEHGCGKGRYIAIWTRMSADLGLVIAITAYLAARWDDHSGMSDLYHVSDVVLLFAGWFTLTLVQRDVVFLMATEKLASHLHHQAIYSSDEEDIHDGIKNLFREQGDFGGSR